MSRCPTRSGYSPWASAPTPGESFTIVTTLFREWTCWCQWMCMYLAAHLVRKPSSRASSSCVNRSKSKASRFVVRSEYNQLTLAFPGSAMRPRWTTNECARHDLQEGIDEQERRAGTSEHAVG